MGAYLEAFDKFRLYALGAFGGPQDTPDIKAGPAASVLRYLKERALKLQDQADGPRTTLATTWQPIGQAIAETPIDKLIPSGVRDEFWRWSKLVCTRADREGLAFTKVTPNPTEDYRVLVASAARDFAPSGIPIVDAVKRGKEGGSGRTPGDQFNLALFLIAAIFALSLGHRARS